MSEYLLSIIGIVFICGILNAVLPEGKTSGMIKATAKLCCLIVILTPVAEFISKGGDKEKIFSDFLDESVIQTDESFINYCSRKRIEETKTLLKEEIKRSYAVDVEVELTWEYVEEGVSGYTANEIKIQAIILSFFKEVDLSLRERICEDLEETYNVEVRYNER